jgi:hypothetical protein
MEACRLCGEYHKSKKGCSNKKKRENPDKYFGNRLVECFGGKLSTRKELNIE